MRLNSTSKQIDTNRVVSKKLDKKIRQKRELLYELHSSEDYSKAQNKVKLMVNDLLNDNKKVLSLAITYCFDTLKKVPKKEILINSLLSSNEENISSIETVLKKNYGRQLKTWTMIFQIDALTIFLMLDHQMLNANTIGV